MWVFSWCMRRVMLCGQEKWQDVGTSKHWQYQHTKKKGRSKKRQWFCSKYKENFPSSASPSMEIMTSSIKNVCWCYISISYCKGWNGLNLQLNYSYNSILRCWSSPGNCKNLEHRKYKDLMSYMRCCSSLQWWCRILLPSCSIVVWL